MAVSDILKSILHPSELLAFINYALHTRQSKDFAHESLKQTSTGSSGKEEEEEMRQDTHRICYMYLVKTSRSFAAVVQALDLELRDAVLSHLF